MLVLRRKGNEVYVRRAMTGWWILLCCYIALLILCEQLFEMGGIQ